MLHWLPGQRRHLQVCQGPGSTQATALPAGPGAAVEFTHCIQSDGGVVFKTVICRPRRIRKDRDRLISDRCYHENKTKHRQTHSRGASVVLLPYASDDAPDRRRRKAAHRSATATLAPPSFFHSLPVPNFRSPPFILPTKRASCQLLRVFRSRVGPPGPGELGTLCCGAAPGRPRRHHGECAGEGSGAWAREARASVRPRGGVGVWVVRGLVRGSILSWCRC